MIEASKAMLGAASAMSIPVIVTERSCERSGPGGLGRKRVGLVGKKSESVWLAWLILGWFCQVFVFILFQSYIFFYSKLQSLAGGGISG